VEQCKPLVLGSHATIEQHVHVLGGHRLGDGDGDRDGEEGSDLGADFTGEEGGVIPGDGVGVGAGELERVRVGTTAGDGVGVVAFNLGYLPGRVVQVDPIKPKLKLPGTKRLKLTCYEPLSRFAFKFKLRRYTRGGAATRPS